MGISRRSYGKLSPSGGDDRIAGVGDGFLAEQIGALLHPLLISAVCARRQGIRFTGINAANQQRMALRVEEYVEINQRGKLVDGGFDGRTPTLAKGGEPSETTATRSPFSPFR